jgi:glutamate-1-semialdehyde 2,1-aminomutase
METLKILSQSEIDAQLETLSHQLAIRIAKAGKERGLSLQVSKVGSILSIFFTAEPVIDYETACRADTELYDRFFDCMLSQGIYLPS